MTLIRGGFFRRGAALAIDLVVLFAANVSLTLLVALIAPDIPIGRVAPVWLSIAWAYFALMESSPAQASVGKVAMGLKVVDRDGAPISFRRASYRQTLKLLSTGLFLVGLLLAAIPPAKRALHDLLAGTMVVRSLPPQPKARHWDPMVLGLHEYWDGQRWVRSER
ncbi:MAG TPA: RDD family protein [Candidatus Dormibacteraeota bacterium]